MVAVAAVVVAVIGHTDSTGRGCGDRCCKGRKVSS